MYLRPRTPFEKFLVQEQISTQDDMGRAKVEFVTCGELVAAIDTVNPKDAEKFSAQIHQISHVLIARHKRAKIGDRLVKGEAIYLIKHVEESIGFVLYYVERRFDL